MLLLLLLLFAYLNLLHTEYVLPKYEIMFDNCTAQIDENQKIHRNFRHIPYRMTFVCLRKDYTKFTVHRHQSEIKENHSSDNYYRENSDSFNATTFISLLQNKTLGFYGDSLTRQLFHAVVAALLPFQTSFVPPSDSPRHHGFSSSTYDRYNATVMLCEDGFGDLLDRKDVNGDAARDYSDCLEPVLLRSDYLLIGIAAWYKPYFRISASTEANFYKNYQLSHDRFHSHIHHLRKSIFQYYENRNMTFSQPKLIWRTSPHASCYEEMMLKYLLSNDSTLTPDTINQEILAKSIKFPHRDGELWSRLAYEKNHTALWVQPYNHIIKELYEKHAKTDGLMDWYDFSMSYIEKVYGGGLTQIHVDTLHYCVNSLPVASLRLLQDAVHTTSQK